MPTHLFTCITSMPGIVKPCDYNVLNNMARCLILILKSAVHNDSSVLAQSLNFEVYPRKMLSGVQRSDLGVDI